MVASEQALGSSIAARRNARRDLRSLITKLPAIAAIGARLTIATSLAGFTEGGRRIERAQKAYRSHLYQATKKAEGLDSALRFIVQRRALGIWKRHEGNKPTTQPPIYFSPSD